ncbi:uncharacterized protein LOC127520467 [Ctenopharyngodon idella]|uniref:uncharacterized protein LOC127520467 n=1 Tax=Ctenopharyngodon idella TaxID=7959 RepID=UPI00222F061B|nr:uncharacterized protein LOC127520467 [Ctenopharyngodon idella]
MFHPVFFCLCLWRLVGVFGVTDAVKTESVSVMEGDSVTLESGLTEIKRNDVIAWTFERPGTLIAQIDKEDKIFSTYDDGPDERFRDRLKLDHQTGSLTITNTRITDSGEYQINIRGMKTTTYRFSVTVYARLTVPVISTDWPSLSSSSSSSSHPISNQTQHLDITHLCHTCSDSVHCCGPTEAVIRLVLSALVGVATVILLVYGIRSRRAERDQAQIHTSESIEI